jgi:hypothetical protein
MHKLARELIRWPDELTVAQLDVCLRHLVEFTGFPPVPPFQLTGYSDAPENHAAGRDIFSGLLRKLAEEYDEPRWVEASHYFDQSGKKLEELTDKVCDFILGKIDTLQAAAMLVAAIAEIEEDGFRLLMKEQ